MSHPHLINHDKEILGGIPVFYGNAGVHRFDHAQLAEKSRSIRAVPAVKTGKRLTRNYDDRYTTYSIPMEGREADLAKALDELKQAPLFITGVGGLGKSRLAAAIVQTGDFSGAVWQRASDVSSPEEIYRLLREHYGLDATSAPAKVLERVHSDGRLLVVIDNAEAIPDASARSTNNSPMT